MMQYMEEVLRRKPRLNFDQRNLFSIVCKNTVGPLRTSWRLADSLIRREAGKHSLNEGPEKMKIVKELKKKCEEDVEKECNKVLDLIDQGALP